MITKRPGRAGKVRVTFALPAAIWADTIYVVGDFNNWDRRATPMRLGDNGWVATLELEPGRSFEYRYLMNDDDWHNDWHADGYAPSPHGGDNSVVITPEFEPKEPEELEAIPSERVISLAARRLRLVHTG
jgi:1,4-alpha-glucan branching enzyme